MADGIDGTDGTDGKGACGLAGVREVFKNTALQHYGTAAYIATAYQVHVLYSRRQSSTLNRH